jgi:hypothetical protein
MIDIQLMYLIVSAYSFGIVILLRQRKQRPMDLFDQALHPKTGGQLDFQNKAFSFGHGSN